MLQSKEIRRPQLVLVVDDQEINRDILGMILEDDGYEVVCACNGLEAIEIMEERAADISIVLLDLIMPVMTGFEVLEQAKEDELLQHIPIIVLTSDKSAELQALQLGAADFITKPFDMHEVILARVARVIELSEGRQLIEAAECDSLTGLYSRNFFMEYANRLVLHHTDLCLDAVVVDIEQFHAVNALKGYEFGDEVLRSIGAEILAYLSESEGIASRFEADAFDIYCNCNGDYLGLLERLQRRVDSMSGGFGVRLRMGVCPWIGGVTPINLFDRAKAACNMARGHLEEPLQVYNEDMRQKELLNLRLLNDLNTAVEERQFKVFYQPKYKIQDGKPRLSSAEALVRWEHPELGMVSPGDFVPLFEGNGIIGMVDNFVWREAARQVAEWRKRLGVALPISVNISRVDLFNPKLEETLVDLVESNGLSYGDLKLEITESSYTKDATRALEVIQGLRDRGFEIEMDDFGTGYSSLNMLSDMPIDVLKMDMKFVRNIEKSETDRRLVSLVLDIARYLRVSVVAEGVETEGQLELLREGGCDLIQGYYFSPPVPPQKFERFFD